MKLVINHSWGGFHPSDIALDVYKARTGKDTPYYNIPRNDLDLIWVVENLGDAASGSHSKLEVIEITGEFYHINDYDGQETVYASDTEIRIY